MVAMIEENNKREKRPREGINNLETVIGREATHLSVQHGERQIGDSECLVTHP